MKALICILAVALVAVVYFGLAANGFRKPAVEEAATVSSPAEERPAPAAPADAERRLDKLLEDIDRGAAPPRPLAPGPRSLAPDPPRNEAP